MAQMKSRKTGRDRQDASLLEHSTREGDSPIEWREKKSHDCNDSGTKESNEVISVSAGPHTIEESSCLGVQLQET